MAHTPITSGQASLSGFLDFLSSGNIAFNRVFGGFGGREGGFGPTLEQIVALEGWLDLAVDLLEERGNDNPSSQAVYDRIAILTEDEIATHLNVNSDLQIPDTGSVTDVSNQPDNDESIDELLGIYPELTDFERELANLPFEELRDIIDLAIEGGLTEEALRNLGHDEVSLGPDLFDELLGLELSSPPITQEPPPPQTQPPGQSGTPVVDDPDLIEDNTGAIGDELDTGTDTDTETSGTTNDLPWEVLLGIIGIDLDDPRLDDLDLDFFHIPILSEIGRVFGQIFGGGSGSTSISSADATANVDLVNAAEALATAIGGSQETIVNNTNEIIINVNEVFQGAGAPVGTNAGPGSARINAEGNLEILGADGVWTPATNTQGEPISGDVLNEPGVGNIIQQAILSLGPLAGIFLSTALAGDVTEINLRNSLEELIELRAEFDDDLVLQDLISERLNLVGREESIDPETGEIIPAVPGQLSILENDIAPVIRNIRAENNQFRRAADLGDLQEFGPGFTEAFDAATPRRAEALDRLLEPNELLDQLVSSAEEGLQSPRDLTGRQLRDSNEAVRSAIDARGGLTRAPRAILDEVFANEFARDRREDRARQFGAGVAGLESNINLNTANTLGRAEADPLLAFLFGTPVNTGEEQAFAGSQNFADVTDFFNAGEAANFNAGAQNQSRFDQFQFNNRLLETAFGG